MKTNFEKFKERLTIDKAVDLIHAGCDCELCPCQKECTGDASDRSCRSFLRNWLERKEDYERIVLKANILGGMNSYILGLGDEDILEPWLMCGVPDGCTEEELMEIAEDDDEFRRIAKEFAKLI
jgi:hypothetical protein